MNHNPTKEKRLEILRSFPESIQDAILSVDLADAFTEIMKKHQLRVDQIKVVADKTNLVMLGIMQPGRLREELQQDLKVSSVAIDKLINELDSRIFIPIRSAIKASDKAPVPEKPASSTAPRKAAAGPQSQKNDAVVMKRSTPRDITEVKLQEQTQIPREEKKFFEGDTYGGQDPYREPIDEKNKK